MQQWVVTNKRADFKAIGEKYGIDPVTARIIRNRDVISDEDIFLYLRGTKENLYDPNLLKDGTYLCEILEEKIKSKKAIRIIGDYDIDGVMSSFILLSALRECNANVSVKIPDRMKDGYGLNIDLITQAKEDGVDTILTCDNGIAALEEIAYAKELGMTVLVTDHHEIPFEEMDGNRNYLRSKADAIVNPHQNECNYPNKDLCGAAVAWKVICLLFHRLGFPKEKSEEYLENVAFATIGDIMNLTGENRILVKEGLKRIRETKNVGMNALIQACGIEKSAIDAYHFGFILGPCINASGRLETAQKALELFFETNPNEATKIAQELVILNEERKTLTLEGVELAKKQYEENGYENDKVLVIYLPNVHESIAGIIAGRIRECYYKPTFVLTDAESGAKGSGRSIEEFSMYEEMCKCKDLFTKFGGHPMAAGLSLPKENIDAFRTKINEVVSNESTWVEKVKIDVPMPISYTSFDLVRELECLAPFGKGNAKPVFADRNVTVTRMWLVGKNQNVLRLTLKTEDGMIVNGIYFGNVEAFMQYCKEKFGDGEIVMNLIYMPKINVYQGRESMQFEIQNYQ